MFILLLVPLINSLFLVFVMIAPRIDFSYFLNFCNKLYVNFNLLAIYSLSLLQLIFNKSLGILDLHNLVYIVYMRVLKAFKLHKLYHPMLVGGTLLSEFLRILSVIFEVDVLTVDALKLNLNKIKTAFLSIWKRDDLFRVFILLAAFIFETAFGAPLVTGGVK